MKREMARTCGPPLPIPFADVDVMIEDRSSAATVEQTTAQGASTARTDQYGSDNVQIFRDAAHIRQRPGMYIGNVAASGLHHLVYELVYNSVDEALAGHCHNIH